MSVVCLHHDRFNYVLQSLYVLFPVVSIRAHAGTSRDALTGLPETAEGSALSLPSLLDIASQSL